MGQDITIASKPTSAKTGLGDMAPACRIQVAERERTRRPAKEKNKPLKKLNKYSNARWTGGDRPQAHLVATFKRTSKLPWGPPLPRCWGRMQCHGHPKVSGIRRRVAGEWIGATARMLTSAVGTWQVGMGLCHAIAGAFMGVVEHSGNLVGRCFIVSSLTEERPPMVRRLTMHVRVRVG